VHLPQYSRSHFLGRLNSRSPAIVPKQPAEPIRAFYFAGAPDPGAVDPLVGEPLVCPLNVMMRREFGSGEAQRSLAEEESLVQSLRLD